VQEAAQVEHGQAKALKHPGAQLRRGASGRSQRSADRRLGDLQLQHHRVGEATRGRGAQKLRQQPPQRLMLVRIEAGGPERGAFAVVGEAVGGAGAQELGGSEGHAGVRR